MDLIDFRRAVQDLLAPELGTFPDGSPALWVEAGDMPTVQNGLLCLIERQPNVIAYTPMMNYEADFHFDWVLRLIQRDRSPPGLLKLDRAIAKLRSRFPIHRERSLPPKDGQYPQITFMANFHRPDTIYTESIFGA